MQSKHTKYVQSKRAEKDTDLPPLMMGFTRPIL